MGTLIIITSGIIILSYLTQFKYFKSKFSEKYKLSERVPIILMILSLLYASYLFINLEIEKKDRITDLTTIQKLEHEIDSLTNLLEVYESEIKDLKNIQKQEITNLNNSPTQEKLKIRIQQLEKQIEIKEDQIQRKEKEIQSLNQQSKNSQLKTCDCKELNKQIVELEKQKSRLYRIYDIIRQKSLDDSLIIMNLNRSKDQFDIKYNELLNISRDDARKIKNLNRRISTLNIELDSLHEQKQISWEKSNEYIGLTLENNRERQARIKAQSLYNTCEEQKNAMKSTFEATKKRMDTEYQKLENTNNQLTQQQKSLKQDKQALKQTIDSLQNVLTKP